MPVVHRRRWGAPGSASALNMRAAQQLMRLATCLSRKPARQKPSPPPGRGQSRAVPASMTLETFATNGLVCSPDPAVCGAHHFRRVTSRPDVAAGRRDDAEGNQQRCCAPAPGGQVLAVPASCPAALCRFELLLARAIAVVFSCFKTSVCGLLREWRATLPRITPSDRLWPRAVAGLGADHVAQLASELQQRAGGGRASQAHGAPARNEGRSAHAVTLWPWRTNRGTYPQSGRRVTP